MRRRGKGCIGCKKDRFGQQGAVHDGCSCRAQVRAVQQRLQTGAGLQREGSPPATARPSWVCWCVLITSNGSVSVAANCTSTQGTASSAHQGTNCPTAKGATARRGALNELRNDDASVRPTLNLPSRQWPQQQRPLLRGLPRRRPRSCRRSGPGIAVSALRSQSSRWQRRGRPASTLRRGRAIG